MMKLPLSALSTRLSSTSIPSGIKAHLLDFTKIAGSSLSLSQSYPNHYALLIENCFTPEECEELISLAEMDKSGWQVAQVNVGYGEQITALDIRNSGRIIRDDFDAAGFIMERVRPFLDEVRRIKRDVAGSAKEGREEVKWKTILNPVKNLASNPEKTARVAGEEWEITRLNERLRFLKYGPGQYFEPHIDGPFTTLQVRPHEPEERTFLTLQAYLRSSPDLQGGATRFFSTVGPWDEKIYYDVDAVPGRVLIFQHRDFVHSGAQVERGEKITLRSDILYRRVDGVHGERWDAAAAAAAAAENGEGKNAGRSE